RRVLVRAQEGQSEGPARERRAFVFWGSGGGSAHEGPFGNPATTTSGGIFSSAPLWPNHQVPYGACRTASHCPGVLGVLRTSASVFRGERRSPPLRCAD